jgi:DhnA family fructose-bisphosphate aldolase class Ia
VVTVERYRDYLEAIRLALPSCDGILASTQPLADIVSSGSLAPGCRTYLSVNRTGLAGAVFELDDRLVASVEAAARAGLSGVKHMVRIDMADPVTSDALELLGKVLEKARSAGLEAMVEALSWRDGAIARDTDSVVFASVVAHDIGAPMLKVPVPDAAPGGERTEAVRRVVESVGCPVLFLGGPRLPRIHSGADARAEDEPRVPDLETYREGVLAAVRDSMAGGASGVAVGRTVIEDPDPAKMAALVAAEVHRAG